ncbi:MAG: glycosyltransferase family 2 protein [Ruegeria sp.]
MADGCTWGIVATIKAPAAEILRFAAHHLDLGAHRLFLYLDEPNPQAFAPLKAHPKVRVLTCDDTYWRRRKPQRPRRHQIRQTANATHAYSRADVDWLAHIDVDEFLWPTEALGPLLAALPADIPYARVRPIEALSGPGNLYKAFIPPGPDRHDIVCSLYPRYGAFVKGGFLSHVGGKIFARTGIDGIGFRIHGLFRNRRRLDCEVELPQVDLCHNHALGWEDWIARYTYRLEKGVYRPGLSPNVPREDGGLSMHELLSGIEREEGETGLRAFFDEISAADPEVRERLRKAGMILQRDLDLDTKLAKHFPGFAATVA